MKFKNWIDLLIFFPITLALAIGSYWFVPFFLKKFGMPEQEMQFTGTAWIYSIFQVWLMFISGVVLTYITYKGCYYKIHEYHESERFDTEFEAQSPTYRVTVSLLIPVALLIAYCLCVIAVF